MAKKAKKSAKSTRTKAAPRAKTVASRTKVSTARSAPADGRDTRAKQFIRYCIVLVMVGAAALSWISLFSYSPFDPPASNAYPPNDPVENSAGIVGAYIAHGLRHFLGVGAYMALLFITLSGFILTFGGRLRDVPWRILGVALLVTATSSAIYLADPDATGDVRYGAAGILGSSVGHLLLTTVADVGGWIITLVLLAMGLMLTADRLVLKLPWLGKKALKGTAVLAGYAGSLIPRRPFDAMGRGPVTPPHARPAEVEKPEAQPAAKSEPAPPAPSKAVALAKPEPKISPAVRRSLLDRLLGRKAPAAAGPGPAAVEPAAPPEMARVKPPVADAPKPGPAVSKPVPKPAEVQRPAVSQPAPRPAPKSRPKAKAKGKGTDGGYVLPTTDLLEPPQRGYSEGQEAVALQRRDVLQQTLTDFNIAAQVEGYQTGPVITMFELSLSPGIKVSQVANLCPDIARALAVPAVRVVSPLPGRDTIGIEVPNLEKEIVRISELMALDPDAERKMKLPIYFGKDAGGEAIIEDLARMPHMLIAGTTGSGKSVCINAIIMAILLTRSPDEVRMILVDPKMVEMAAFEQVPHLLCPIINDMNKAEEILEWAVQKMDERYEVLKEAGVKNIAAFNKLSEDEIYKRFEAETEEDKLRIPTSMPYYVIIIDELADLIMTSSKEVEEHIIRIAQKARAVGIHLILATQRPSANVVTGLIKSNMPCRVSFRVASRQESRIVLDHNGAEVLLGQGDMLFLRPGSSTLVRAQGTFVDDSEIHGIVEEIEDKNGQPVFDAELTRLQSRPAGADDGGERDELFDKAVEIVLASQRGSVSLLQRRLSIGYSRSSRIIDQMAQAGLLGEYKGSQARECLMTLEDWLALKASIDADQSGASSLNGEPTSV